MGGEIHVLFQIKHDLSKRLFILLCISVFGLTIKRCHLVDPESTPPHQTGSAKFISQKNIPSVFKKRLLFDPQIQDVRRFYIFTAAIIIPLNMITGI